MYIVCMEKKEQVTVTLRFPADLHRALVELAEREMRSLNAEVVKLLKDLLQEREPKGKRSAR